mgnify:FL=1
MSIVDDIPAPAPCCPVVDNRVGGGYNESVLLAKGDEGDVVPDSLLCLFRNEEANDVSAALLFPFPKAFPYPLELLPLPPNCAYEPSCCSAAVLLSDEAGV